MDALARWASEEGSACLVHGDLRLDNVVFDREEPRILAILDWELSTLGPPLIDVSYFCTMLRLPRDGLITGLVDLNRADLCLPSEVDIVSAFSRFGGAERPADRPMWLAFHAFRFAAILQGVARRHLDGNAANANADRAQELVHRVARLGVSFIEDGTR